MARRLTLDFLKTEAAAGVLLAFAAFAGILAANGPWRDSYFAAIERPLPVQLGDWRVTLAAADWVKQGLMTLFFFVVGLEIKYELIKGELSSPRRLALPVAAAVGGMIAPALVYLAVNLALPGGRPRGWPIPTATDIAFALAALAAAGRGAPPALRTFLLALAVADDLGAVVLIAVVFTRELDTGALAAAAVVLSFMALLSRWRGAPLSIFVVAALVLWALTLKSGVSPSVAGVAAAMTLPLRPRRLGERGVLEGVLERLHPYVAYGVLPLFAFCAVGFSSTGIGLRQLIAPVPLGVIAALLIGKPLGVMAASASAVGLGWARRPTGVGWPDLFAVSLLCGVGFTMSLFLGGLAFAGLGHGAETTVGVKLGVAGGSFLSFAAGVLVLRGQARRRADPDLRADLKPGLIRRRAR